MASSWLSPLQRLWRRLTRPARGAALADDDTGETPPSGSSSLPPDRSLESHFRQAKLRYQVDEDGDYRLGWELDGGRRVVVLFFVRPERSLGRPVRRFYASLAEPILPVTPELAQYLLRENSRFMWGCWAHHTTPDGTTVPYLTGFIPARLTYPQFQEVVHSLLQVVDGLRERSTRAAEFLPD